MLVLQGRMPGIYPDGGGGGIRTPGPLAGTHDFESCAIVQLCHPSGRMILPFIYKPFMHNLLFGLDPEIVVCHHFVTK